MRILLLTTKPPWPEHDGGSVASSRIIQGLTSCGAEMYVLSLTTPKHNLTDTVQLPQATSLIIFEKIYIDTSIRIMPLLKNLFFSAKPYDLERFYSSGLLNRIKDLCASEKFDIIQCEGLVFANYVREIRKFTNAVIILRAHNIEHHIRAMMARQEKNILKKIYLRNLASRVKKTEQECRQLFDAVIPISEDDGKWFTSQHGTAPVFVSVTGVDINPSIPETGNYRVGFIGSLDWQPNVEGLLWFVEKVWPAVNISSPGATLNIAGKNADTRTRKKLKGRNVIFEGEVDDADLFISSMTLMIAPLFTGSGMRIKIIESMNAGVPVIASPIAAMGLPVTNGKDIIISSDTDEFISSVNELITNNLLRKNIATCAKQTLKINFDNNIITGKLFDFYKTLINDR
jgi:polysaccharide biosynthesis protein PslH